MLSGERPREPVLSSVPSAIRSAGRVLTYIKGHDIVLVYMCVCIRMCSYVHEIIVSAILSSRLRYIKTLCVCMRVCACVK